MQKRLLLFVFFFHSAFVMAHDIGVTEVILQEQPEFHYLWQIENPGSTSDAISAPRLPTHCQFMETQGNADNHSLYRFHCAKPLSTSDRIELSWRTEIVMVKAVWLDLSEHRATFLRDNEIIAIDLTRLSTASGSWQDTAMHYLVIGMEHILTGIDHLLFVLGILLLVTHLRALVLSITTFTLAHSLSLALAYLDWVNLNSAPVEACIALSIVVLALEVLRGQSGNYGFTWKYPWIICAGFGLLHGLGFAGALADIHVPSNEITLALLFFNLGVEIGQLLFVGTVLCGYFIWILLRKHRGWQFGSLPTSRTACAYIIGSLASFWVIERSMVIFL